jgi:AraC family transcriptional regulator of adaptative response / DNA-3-methyladenine glycosylase II
VTTALDHDSCYRAVASRDARFDGCFVTAVRTTGIYCRPSCPAITPRPGNVSFLPTAAAAQHAGYRACRRCLPDAAPGSPEWDLRGDLAARAVRLIADGVVERAGVAGLAADLGYSERQLNRVLTEQLGAGPLALARAHRAHTARLLLQTTALPVADVAFAAGFASVRQFNDTVREVFAVTPSVLRSEVARPRGDGAPPVAGVIRLRLPFRAPMDAGWTEWFLAGHALGGAESWHDGEYARTLALPNGSGVARVQLGATHVALRLRLDDLRDLGAAVTRVRRLLDLDADPVAVDAALAADPALAPGVAATPGIRVLGSVDGAEVLLRTVLGQQVSLAAARTAGTRLVAALGTPMATPDGELTHLFPAPAVVAERGHEVLTGPARRVATVLRVAAALADGSLALHPGRDGDELRAELLALPGIGPWTADYVLMRVLGDPDVLLGSDLVLRQGAARLGLPGGARELAAHATRWSPWRSYAGMHLWKTELDARARTKETIMRRTR